MIQNARTWFNQTPFKKGADVAGSKKALTEAESAAKRFNGSIRNAGKSINRVTRAIASAVSEMANVDTTYGQAAARINSFVGPQKTTSSPKKSKGRVAKHRAVSKTVNAALKTYLYRVRRHNRAL